MTTSVKAIPVSSYPESAWRLVLGLSETSDELGVHGAYARVPIVYRCVRLRAKAVQAMPFALMRGKRDMTEQPEYEALVTSLSKILYQFEASLCIYGAAYALRQRGRYTGDPSLRWVSSSRVTPKYDKDAGLTGFSRSLGRETQMLRPEDVVYSWLPILDADIGPGVAPAAVALRAAGVLDNLDIFLQGFFERGALRVTLFSVEGNPPEGELQRLETWWRKILAGVKNAFKTVAVRANVTPVTVGDSLKDTIDVALNDAKILQVMAAMEVPASLGLPNAANYATARQDWLSFYQATIVPEAALIIQPINAWLDDAYGLRLVPHPERLEVFQQSELEKAASLAQLAGTSILTQSEARERLELPDLAPDLEEQTLVRVRAQLEVIKLAKDAGIDPYDIAAIVGLDLPEAPPPPPAAPALPPPAPVPALPPPAEEVDEEIAMRHSVEVSRWQRKALNRGADCEFRSIWIEPDEMDLIRERLAHATDPAAVKAAFKQAPPGSDLDEREQALYDGLRRVLGSHQTSTINALLRNERPDLTPLPADLRALLLPALTDIALTVATDAASGIGPDLDPASGATAAGEWAREHAGELIRGLDEQTRRIVGQAVASYLETPSMSRAQLTALLSGAFGDRRAEVIAITEATRASAAGWQMTQRHLSDQGLTFTRVWHVARDDRVCPICVPLDGQPEEVWAAQFPNGPAAHPRCRCFLTLQQEA